MPVQRFPSEDAELSWVPGVEPAGEPPEPQRNMARRFAGNRGLLGARFARPQAPKLGPGGIR